MLNLAIAGIARDCEKALLERFNKFLKSLRLLHNVDLFIVENDSLDGTKQIAAAISKACVIENLGIPKYESSTNKERALFLAGCRNKYLELVARHNKPYNYLIVSDFDIKIWPDIKIIDENLQRMESNDNIGFISSNGLDIYNSREIYYDIWPLCNMEKKQVDQVYFEPPHEGYHEVTSAFGGLTIYRYLEEFSLEEHPKYDSFLIRTTNNEIKPTSEHVNFNFCFNNYKNYIDYSQILYR